VCIPSCLSLTLPGQLTSIGVVAGEAVKQVAPVYPPVAKAAHVSGLQQQTTNNISAAKASLEAGDILLQQKRYSEAFIKYLDAKVGGDNVTQGIAALRIGMMYRQGNGFSVDYVLSANWLKNSAARGNAAAQSILQGDAQAKVAAESRLAAQRAAEEQAATVQVAPQQADSPTSEDAEYEDAQQKQREIRGQIADLRRDIESSQQIADQADKYARDMISSCNGDGMCLAISNIGAAKETAMANKRHNQVDSDNEEIARLEGQEVEVQPRRSTSFASTYSQTTAANPTPTINDAVAQQWAQANANAAAIRQRQADQAAQQLANQQAEARRQQAAQDAARAAQIQRQQAAARNQPVATAYTWTPPPVRPASSPPRTSYSYKGRSYDSHNALMAAAQADHNCALHPESGETAPCDDTIARVNSFQRPPANPAKQPPARTGTTQAGRPIYVSFAFSNITNSVFDDHSNEGDGTWGFGESTDQQSSINKAYDSCQSRRRTSANCSSGGSFVASRDGSPKWFALALSPNPIQGDSSTWSNGEGLGFDNQGDAENSALTQCHKPGFPPIDCKIVYSAQVGGR